MTENPRQDLLRRYRRWVLIARCEREEVDRLSQEGLVGHFLEAQRRAHQAEDVAEGLRLALAATGPVPLDMAGGPRSLALTS